MTETDPEMFGRELVERRTAMFAERWMTNQSKTTPDSCSQVAINVETATVEELRAEVARLDLRLRWMHDHYDDMATVSMMTIYRIADQRDELVGRHARNIP